jgi:hypothetical protein
MRRYAFKEFKHLKHTVLLNLLHLCINIIGMIKNALFGFYIKKLGNLKNTIDLK